MSEPITVPALQPGQTNAIEAMRHQRMKIPGDLVNQATQELADKPRSALRWLHSHAVDANLSLEELAAMLKKPDGTTYSRDSVYQALTGRRTESGVGLDNFVEAIERLKIIIEERKTIIRSGFVETTLTRRIWKICDAALTFQKVMFIYGPSQIGKTTALEEYARQHNHGQTVYVRVPTGGTVSEFSKWLAVSLRISPQLNEFQLKERIFKAFDDRMLLIIDEANECFSGHYSDRSIRTLNFCREIHDRRKCGLVIAGDRTLEREIKSGLHKEQLEKLGLRSLAGLRLPDKPSAENLNTFAACYRLEPATGDALTLQTTVIRDSGLGKWCTLLMAASRMAAKQKGARLSWRHVLEAHRAIQKLEDPA